MSQAICNVHECKTVEWLDWAGVLKGRITKTAPLFGMMAGSTAAIKESKKAEGLFKES